MNKDSKVIHATIRLPRSLRGKAEKRAKERELKSLSGSPNFSRYVRELIKKDVKSRTFLEKIFNKFNY